MHIWIGELWSTVVQHKPALSNPFRIPSGHFLWHHTGCPSKLWYQTTHWQWITLCIEIKVTFNLSEMGYGRACTKIFYQERQQVLELMVSTHRMKSSSLSPPAQVFESLYSAAEAWNWSSTSNLDERSKVKLQTSLLPSEGILDLEQLGEESDEDFMLWELAGPSKTTCDTQLTLVCLLVMNGQAYYNVVHWRWQFGLPLWGFIVCAVYRCWLQAAVSNHWTLPTINFLSQQSGFLSGDIHCRCICGLLLCFWSVLLMC